MKVTPEITIKDYRSNIEVFAHFPNSDLVSNGGRVLSIDCDSDTIPSASYIPTIRELWEEADKIITLEQAREVKEAIRSNCSWID